MAVGPYITGMLTPMELCVVQQAVQVTCLLSTPRSGVSLDTFQKKMTVQNLTLEGLQRLGPSVAKMAEVEGLEAHRRAVTLRLGMH
jgi:histidinol dehydrogenase